MFTVYVLYSPAFKKIYIGYSSDLAGRLAAHNEFSKKGWTKKFRPWLIIHQESFSDKKTALKREKSLKTAKGREFIWSLIKQN